MASVTSRRVSARSNNKISSVKSCSWTMRPSTIRLRLSESDSRPSGLVKLERNLGFAGGNNAGARVATGRHLAFLNNDTRVNPSWLGALRRAIDGKPDVGFVTSRIVYMHDPAVIDSAGDCLTRSGDVFKRGHGDSSDRLAQPREVFGACGAACLFRRGCLLRLRRARACRTCAASGRHSRVPDGRGASVALSNERTARQVARSGNNSSRDGSPESYARSASTSDWCQAPAEMPPAVSVVIINYNTADDLRRCLSSLDEGLAAVVWDCIVIDNGSTDGSFELNKLDNRLRTYRNTENVGFAHAVNQGLAVTEGVEVLILNPDCELLPGSIAVLHAELDRYPDCVVVGPRVVDPDGTIQGSARGDPTMFTGLFGRSSLLTRRFPRSPLAKQNIRTPPRWSPATLVSSSTGLPGRACWRDEKHWMRSAASTNASFCTGKTPICAAVCERAADRSDTCQVPPSSIASGVLRRRHPCLPFGPFTPARISTTPPTLLDRPSTRRDGSQSFCSGFGTNGFCVAPKGRIVQTYGGFGTDY